jgi:hypothetical protein
MTDPTPPFTHDELEAFANELRDAFVKVPPADVRQAHLAAMSAEVPAAAPSAQPAGRIRKLGLRGAVAAAGLVLVGGSALAATGTLPVPVQNAIADAVDVVVDIPGGHGVPKNPIAAQHKSEAKAFVTAKKAWLACMKDAKATATPGTDGAVVATNASCGEKPNPHDFRAGKTPKPDKTEKPDKTPDADDTPKPGSPERTTNPGGRVPGRPVQTTRPSHTPKPTATMAPTATPVVTESPTATP